MVVSDAECFVASAQAGWDVLRFSFPSVYNVLPFGHGEPPVTPGRIFRDETRIRPKDLDEGGVLTFTVYHHAALDSQSKYSNKFCRHVMACAIYAYGMRPQDLCLTFPRMRKMIQSNMNWI